MEELIYISVNHWACGDTYPDIEPLATWLDDDNIDKYLMSPGWVKEQGISVLITLVDMSFNFNIIAPKSWVDKIIPDIYKFPKFIMQKDEDGKYRGRYCGLYPSKFEPGCIYSYQFGDDFISKVLRIDENGQFEWEDFEKVESE